MNNSSENAQKIEHLASGKVREIHGLGSDRLAIVTTDRLSAYDVILDDPIPDRGRVLNLMSVFWMQRFADKVSNHLLSVADDAVAELASAAPEIGTKEELIGRTAIVRRAEMLPIECIVRGYLYGSAWREYKATGTATGLDLPAGMQIAEQLPEPTFTPSTKATDGHDENIDMTAARGLVGDMADELAQLSVDLYVQASEYARERGVIIADTKFEFGLIDGELVWCDEAFTPDSSRFWYVHEWQPGQDPPALDKQFVRSYLDTTDWDKTAPAPRLPSEVIAQTRARYVEAYEVLTDDSFPWAAPEATS